MALYAIGDVHGCMELLRSLLGAIAEDAANHPAKRKVLVCLGDYVDRGGDSRAVIDCLLHHQPADFTCIFLKGNHEDAMVRFLDGEAIGASWIDQGAIATFFSYGVRPPRRPADAADLMRARNELAANLPDGHLDFLRALPLSHIEGDYLFVHAGLRPGLSLEQQDSEDMIWIRDEFLRSNFDFGKVVVHGHNIALEPEIRPNRIGIDTGAFASGRLTCLVLDGAERLFIQT